MAEAIKSNVTASDLAALQNDIAVLKRDVSTVLDHLRSTAAGAAAGAAGNAHSAASQLEEGAHRLYRNLTAEGERSVKAIGRHIEDQPWVTLLLALGVSYIGGRLLSR